MTNHQLLWLIVILQCVTLAVLLFRGYVRAR
jgi:hypothetical protein